jgi:hypothetical protein
MKDREIFLKLSTRIVEQVNTENPVFWGVKARIFPVRIHPPIPLLLTEKCLTCI